MNNENNTTDLFNGEHICIWHNHEQVFITMSFVTVSVPIRNFDDFAMAISTANDRLERQREEWLRNDDRRRERGTRYPV